MKTALSLLSALLIPVCMSAQKPQFDSYFTDSTLRIDYTFAGNAQQVQIYPEETHLVSGWYGRRQHLDSLALAGTGRITMRDSLSGQVIYRHSFSSLFQEWLSTDEAKEHGRSFENVYLLPYPRKTTIIDIELDNMHRERIAHESFVFRPQDILVHRHHEQTTTPHRYLHRGADSHKAIDIAILAEGYTKAEMPKFLQDAERAARELLRYEPFHSYQDRINIVAVETPSVQSGVSVPRLGDWRQTAFASHFDTFYSDRYLTSRRLKSVHDALLNIPYEHIIILANTETYGGGGIYNSYTLSSLHPKHFLPVVVHEFGHSFGGLADEYFYEHDTMSGAYNTEIEPWEQNITSLKDFQGKKWSNLIHRKTPLPTPTKEAKKYGIGAYEGAAYMTHGMYRPNDDCRMRTNTFPTFCPACHQALERLIRYYTE